MTAGFPPHPDLTLQQIPSHFWTVSGKSRETGWSHHSLWSWSFLITGLFLSVSWKTRRQTVFAIKSNINIQNPPVNELWNSSKMHWKTSSQNPLLLSRSVRYGNVRNKKTASISLSQEHSLLYRFFLYYIPGWFIHRFSPQKATTGLDLFHHISRTLCLQGFSAFPYKTIFRLIASIFFYLSQKLS